jgi:hypothetical protein
MIVLPGVRAGGVGAAGRGCEGGAVGAPVEQSRSCSPAWRDDRPRKRLDGLARRVALTLALDARAQQRQIEASETCR